MSYRIQKLFTYLFLILSTLALFTACQKESIEVAAINENQSKQNVTPPTENDELIELTIETNENTNSESASSRGLERVYSGSFYVGKGNWKGFSYPKSRFNGRTYYAYVTPTSGDPDLYAYARNDGEFRRIRYSRNTGKDDTYISANDLYSTDDHGEFWVKGFSNTNFKIEIYRTTGGGNCIPNPIDDPELVCATIWDPVCGCDGNTYSNDCFAYLAGVTVVSAGECSGNGGGSNCNSCTSYGGSLTICESMDSYATGNISNQSTDWRKWSSNSNDAEITTYRSYSGSKSMRVRSYSSGSKEDVILKVGSHTRGTHRIAWKMYIPSGRSAYFNVQKSTTPGVEWGSNIYFYTNGRGKVQSGGSSKYFNYPQREWFDVELIISIANNSQYLYVNGQFVRAWNYSNSVSGTNGRRSLGGINFYAVGDNSYFYIDNVCFEKDYPFYTTQGGRIMPHNDDTLIDDMDQLDLKKQNISLSNM